MIHFIEHHISTTKKIEFQGWMDILLKILNKGPECYRRFLFTSIGFNNSGFICEHDIFSILENYKQKDNFLFVKELISQETAPADYKTLTDDSDKTFFDAFTHDLKKILPLLLVIKQMIGIEDDGDLDTEFVSEETLTKDINFIIEKICKYVEKNQHAEIA